MCECIAKVNEELQKQFPNTMLETPIFGPQRTLIRTCKRNEKVREKPKSVFATYCPFCGQKHEDNK